MYTDGSNALKNEYYTHPSAKRYTEKETAGKKNGAGINVRLLKKRAIVAVFLAFTMAFIVTYRCALITKEFGTLSDAKDRLELLNAQVVEMQMKAEGNLDPKKVEQEAQRLGFSHPAKNQIKYISLGNTDTGEVLKTEKPSALSAFINRASVILEYLN